MTIALDTTNELLDHLDAYDIIPEVTKAQLQNLTKETFIFKEQLDLAESIHLHIKVPDTALLPHDELKKCGGCGVHVQSNCFPGRLRCGWIA